MIYLSLTTIPERINNFVNFYKNITSGTLKPDKIIVNIYSESLRKTKLIIPEEILNLEDVIFNNHNIDYGPILKFLGVYNHLVKNEDIFIYCDDDIKYDYCWLENLVFNIKLNPNKILAYKLHGGLILFNKFYYLPYLKSNCFIRGFGGVGFYKKTIIDITKYEIINYLDSYEKKMSDDLILSYFFSKYKFNCERIQIEPTYNYYEISDNDHSISKGIFNTINKNKIRYFELCKKNHELLNIFNYKNYFFGNNECKNYSQEFYNLLNKIKNKEYICFLRYNDGELNILKKNNYKSREYEINYLDDKLFYHQFEKTFLVKDKNYIIGIPCICCEEKDKFRNYILKNYEINNEQLTYANLFNNSNYYKFKYELLPIIKNYDIILICNEDSKIINLLKKGYHIKKVIYIPKYNAFKQFDKINTQIINYTVQNKINNHMYLFCSGFLSNILIYNLYNIEKNNYYIDIGSSMDNELELKNRRNYNNLFGWKILSNCTWNNKYKFNISCYSGDYNKFHRIILKIIGFIYHIILFLIYLCIAEQ